MTNPLPRTLVHSRTYSTPSERVDFLGDERGHMTIPTHAGALLIIDDRVPDDGCLHTPSPYLAKCKRLRTDGPTPCLCCPGECVGDWLGYSYEEALAEKRAHGPSGHLIPDDVLLPDELDERLRARARSRDWQQPLFLLWLAPATAAMLVLGLYGKLRGWW